MEIGDDAFEDPGLQVFARRVATETVDLDQQDPVGLGQGRRKIVPHRARAGEAGDQDHRLARSR